MRLYHKWVSYFKYSNKATSIMLPYFVWFMCDVIDLKEAYLVPSQTFMIGPKH